MYIIAVLIALIVPNGEISFQLSLRPIVTLSTVPPDELPAPLSDEDPPEDPHPDNNPTLIATVKPIATIFLNFFIVLIPFLFLRLSKNILHCFLVIL